MKDEHRKFKSCIFCNARFGPPPKAKRSAEHVFGKAVANLFPTLRNWRAGFYGEKGLQGSSPVVNLTSRSVCEPCNNEWLSAENEAALPIIEKLKDGQSITLEIADQRKLYRYLARLCAIVDAESSNRDLTMKQQKLEAYARKFGGSNLFPPIITETSRNAFRTGDDIPVLKVWVGRHDGHLGHNPTFNLVRAPSSTGIAKRILLVLGHLVIVAHLRFGLMPLPRGLIGISSTPSSSVNWALANNIGYEDYYSLYAPSPEIMWVIYCYKTLPIKERIDEIYAETGKIIFPDPPWLR
mgnify:CR=1 FL=1